MVAYMRLAGQNYVHPQGNTYLRPGTGIIGIPRPSNSPRRRVPVFVVVIVTVVLLLHCVKELFGHLWDILIFRCHYATSQL